MDNITEILLNEKTSLRNELQHLKQCQLRYFVLSITVTGVIFGVGAKLEENFDGSIFLAPLLVVIPCWWIFFDKAKTISRIIGYYRILENIVNGDECYTYIGWENSLEKFRRHKQENALTYNKIDKYDKKEKIRRLSRLDVPHKYWVINWYTYAILSILSLFLSLVFYSKISLPFSLLGMWAIYFTIRYNLNMIIDLIFGDSSYVSNEKCWEEILKA